MRLRETLRAIRKQRGLTQAALATKAGLDRVTIAEIETGSVRDPRFATIAKLARALRCKPAELVGDEYRTRRTPPVRQ